MSRTPRTGGVEFSRQLPPSPVALAANIKAPHPGLVALHALVQRVVGQVRGRREHCRPVGPLFGMQQR